MQVLNRRFSLFRNKVYESFKLGWGNRGRQDICNKSTLLRKLTNYKVVLNSYACLVK